MTSSQATYSSFQAWQNRWKQPTVDDLLADLKSHHQRVFEKLQEQLATLDKVEQQIAWRGTGWHWTIECLDRRPISRTRSKTAALSPALCYLVPRLEEPLVCVPLTPAVIEQLPLRRLSKVVREGVRVAKWAVQTHWATWTPSNQSEAEQLFDLVRRKYTITAELAGRATKN